MRRTHMSVLFGALAAMLVAGLSTQASAQQVYTGTPITYDFTGYGGLGLQPTPLAAQLDSDELQVVASSSSACLFGATCTTSGTFAQGASAGSVTSGGLYAFRAPIGDTIFGVQPTTSVFSSTASSSSAGLIWIRFINGTGAPLGTIRFADETWVLNNEGRTTQVSTFFTNDLGAVTRVPVASLTTPTAPDAPAVWQVTPFSGAVDLSSLAVANGAPFYLVFAINDAVGGSGSRDEIGFDDITISLGCGNGVVDAGEACDAGVSNGVSICGCRTSCGFGAADTACAPTSGGVCDVADSCDGAGTCVNRFVAAGTVCRTAVDLCGAAESCTGSTPGCPTDVNLAPGTVCRPAAMGGCDAAEVCTGSSSCPADAFQPPGTVCAPSSGAPCDVDDVCTGTLACPSAVATAGTMCRPASGACDATDACDGTSTSCADAAQPDGADCGDSLACNGDETCLAGACAPGAPVLCSDVDVCTADACSELTGACAFTAISDCCVDDATCGDTAVCTLDACDLTTNRCTHTAIASCCTSDDMCDDANACTTNTCEAGGLCTTVAIADCCNAAGDCDDGDACTTDDCTGAGGACTHDAIAGCGVDASMTADAGTDAATARDAGMRDSGGSADGSRVDGGSGDGSRVDGSTADSGTAGGALGGGCGCTAAGATGGPSASLLGLGLALVLVARRRRR